MTILLATAAALTLAYVIPATLAWALIHGAERINRKVTR